MLFEELSETFPAEVVEPYGEVLIVPVKAFKPEWRSMLEAEGVQIYTNAFRGQVCFFLRKKASNQAAQEQPQPNVVTAVTTSSQPQNVEDAVVQLVEQGLGFKEIQQRLGLTSGRLMGVFSSLSRKGVLQKLGWVPMRKRSRKPSSNSQVQIPIMGKEFKDVKPNLNASNLPVREMLQASLKILDEYPRVARFLLEKCVEVLT